MVQSSDNCTIGFNFALEKLLNRDEIKMGPFGLISKGHDLFIYFITYQQHI